MRARWIDGPIVAMPQRLVHIASAGKSLTIGMLKSKFDLTASLLTEGLLSVVVGEFRITSELPVVQKSEVIDI